MIWTNVRPATTRLNRPAVNTYEVDDAFHLELSLPGWNKESINLEIDGDLLLVKGDQQAKEKPSYRRQEFGITSFEKSFHLPETVDLDRIEASLQHGILQISLPKVPEAQPIKKAIAVA